MPSRQTHQARSESNGGLGHERGPVNPVEATGEIDDRFSEQSTKQLDLLLLACSTGMEVLPEGLVLDIVPTDSHAEPEPTPRQEVDIGRLACHERGLALRQDQNPGGESDSLGDARQVGKHHEWVMERIVLGVGAYQWRRPIGMDGSEDMVVGQKMVEAQVFDRPPEMPTAMGSPRSSIWGYATPISMALSFSRDAQLG